MAEANPKHIVIIGAGVTGLQTALSLLTCPSNAEGRKYKVTLIASHVPGDEDREYTSPWAGGHWRSHAYGEGRESGWDERTYGFWRGLLEGGSEGDGEGEVVGMGLGFRESRNFWGVKSAETASDGSGIWWSTLVRNFKILDLTTEPHPPNALFGVSYTSICINVPVYLKYLWTQVNAHSATIIKMEPPLTTTAGLAGFVRPALQILDMASPTGEDVPREDVLCLVNCTGLSARKFVGEVEAAKLYPVRGQTVLVRGEAKMARTYLPSEEDCPGDELAYVIPRPGSGTTILGGCKQARNESSAVDEELTERILGRVKEWGLAEELRTGEGGEFEVVSTQVGFRPGREGGARVEKEAEKVEGIWVVHSYGHAGAGYQNSVGCAEEVVKIIEGLS